MTSKALATNYSIQLPLKLSWKTCLNLLGQVELFFNFDTVVLYPESVDSIRHPVMLSEESSWESFCESVTASLIFLFVIPLHVTSSFGKGGFTSEGYG